MDFNINENVMVRLTEQGRQILKEQHEKFCEDFPAVKHKFKPKKEDKGGWSEWQMWVLMETFGPHLNLGCNPPFETTIKIPKNG